MTINLTEIIKLAKLGTKEKIELARTLLLEASLDIPTINDIGKKDAKYLEEVINKLKNIA